MHTKAEGSENESGLCAFGTEEREFQRPQRLRKSGETKQQRDGSLCGVKAQEKEKF